jgi:2,3-bisphosphoglycerate-independent phosphoglycerate mutase
MKSIDVEGATGNVHTNYRGKAEAAVKAFSEGADYVYIHVEAPDECGHRAETQNKVLSIEKIDAEILAPLLSYLEGCGEDFRIMVLPDHPTPIELRTHTSNPVPFFIYDCQKSENGVSQFCEENATATGYYVKDGYRLMELLTK